jgi:DNA-binding GntR family transcriptional regulator
VRAQIVTGALEAGARLMEPLLAENLGVSRTPVREALRRLGQEGLVRRNPRDLGRYVNGLGPDEIRKVLGVRAVLEGYAARLAAERATEDELAVLGATHERAARVVDDGDIDQLVELNTQFHDGIIAASRAPHCAALIDALRDRILQYRFAFLRNDRLRHKSFLEHRAILTALQARDADRAELLVRRHVAQIAEALADEHRHPEELPDA